MALADIIGMLTRLGVGAIATFFAILLWSKTRDLAWILAVMAVLVSYAEILLSTLEEFGIVDQEIYQLNGLPIFKMLLVNLPAVFLTAAFIIVILRKRSF